MFRIILLQLTLTTIVVNSLKNEYKIDVMGDDQRLSGIGQGWDYLEDSSRFPIFRYDYNGQRTNDQQYLVPECFNVEDIKKTTYTAESNIVEKSTNYVSKFSSTFQNGGQFGFGLFVGVGGSYSRDRQIMIQEQAATNTITVSTKYIDHRYTFHANSKCPLDDKFISTINEIAEALSYGFNNAASWYSEQLVAEYGTHYLSRVDIGAMLFIDDYISNSYWKINKQDKETIKKVTKNRFLFFSSSSSSTSSTLTSAEDSYYNSVVKNRTDSIGGRFIPGMNLTQWIDTIDKNMVVINKEVGLISNAISKFNFPNIDESVLGTIRNMVVNVNQNYIRANTRSGCTDQRMVMFNATSNYESNGNVCAERYKFGGTFAETIYCKEMEYDANYNPTKCKKSFYKCDDAHLITKQRTCPTGYKPRTGFYVSRPEYRFNLTECYGDDTKEKGGMLFGGTYSDKAVNPVTGDKSCPKYFAPFSLFDCNKNQICLSLDLDNAISYAIPFFGFVSTCIPNRSCPYEQYYITEYNGCKLYFCTSLSRSKAYPQMRKMPFSVKPNKEINLLKQLRKQRN